MKIHKIFYISVFVILSVTAGVFSLKALQSKKITSQKNDLSSDEDMHIALEDSFLDGLYTRIILRAGYDCPYPNEFDEDSIEEGPEKEAAYRKGVEFCENEAKKGSLTHQECLAHYFCSINKDMKQALYWATKSAEQGSYQGMMILCAAYSQGNGVLADTSESIKWLLLAKTAGNKRAIKIVRELGEVEVYQEIFMKGKFRAKQWMEAHPDVFFNPDDNYIGKP